MYKWYRIIKHFLFSSVQKRRAESETELGLNLVVHFLVTPGPELTAVMTFLRSFLRTTILHAIEQIVELQLAC